MIYLFNNKEELIKVLDKSSLKSVEQVQSLTDEGYVSDQLFVEVKNLSEDFLAEVEYVANHSVESRMKFNLYYLLRHNTNGSITSLDCVQSGIEELMKAPIYDIRPQGDARQHIERILTGSRWQAQYVPKTAAGTKTYYYIDAFTALKKMCAFFAIEMQFHVEINGNHIGARYIEFKERIGQVTHKRVTYGHNALEIVCETQKDQIYTALIGRGRGEQVSEAGTIKKDGTIQESDGYGRKVTFEDLVWSKAKGDPVDKPKGQQYVEDKEATARYGIDGKPKIGFIEFDTEDRATVLKRTYEALKEYSRPRAELKTTAVYLDARIGDTVRVVRHDLKLDYPVRVFEVKWDRLSETLIELRLGDILHESASKRQSRMMSAIKADIAGATGEMSDKLLDYVTSANGFKMNFYSKTEPDNPKIGDSWFAPDPEFEGEYILKVWNGKIWKEIIRTKNWNEVNNKLEEAEKRVIAFKEELDKKQQRNEAELAEFKDTQQQAFKEIKIDIENKGNGLRTTIADLKNKMESQITQLAGQVDLRVTRNDVMGIINNSGDAIYLAIKGKMTGRDIKNAIAIDQSGIQISGKHLGITADTYIANGVIKNAHISDLSANKITTGTFNAANAKIINLDINSLSGNLARFIETLFDGKNSKVKIDATGMRVMTNSGNYSSFFNDNGIQIWRSGTHVGSVHSLDAQDTEGAYQGLKSMSLTTQPDAYLSLSYYSLGDNKYYRALSLGGDGRLRIHAPFNIGDTNRGWAFKWGTMPRAQGEGRQDATLIKDIFTNRYFGISDDGDFWMPLNADTVVSSTMIWNKLMDLQQKYHYMKQELKTISENSSNWGGGGYTPDPEPEPYEPPKPKPKPRDEDIHVGDRVKLKSGVTYYYDNDDRAVRIPEYSHSGQPIRNATFTVGRLRAWGHQRYGYYELFVGGWQIAWAAKGDVYKV